MIYCPICTQLYDENTVHNCSPGNIRMNVTWGILNNPWPWHWNTPIYVCPNCHGVFSQWDYAQGEGTTMIGSCPFCGMEKRKYPKVEEKA